MITPAEGDHYEALIPKWRHVTTFEGEHVEKGEEGVRNVENVEKHV